MEILVKFFDDEEVLRELTLPCDLDEELENMIGEDYHLEYEVDDVKLLGDDLEGFNVDVDELFKGESTIEEYNSRVEELTDMIEGIDDLDDVKAVMNVGYNNFLSSLETVYNESCIIYRNVYSEEDFAQEYVEEIGSWSGVEIPRNSSLWYYIDWEKVARDLFMDLNYDSETNRVVDLNY